MRAAQAETSSQQLHTQHEFRCNLDQQRHTFAEQFRIVKVKSARTRDFRMIEVIFVRSCLSQPLVP